MIALVRTIPTVVGNYSIDFDHIFTLKLKGNNVCGIMQASNEAFYNTKANEPNA